MTTQTRNGGKSSKDLRQEVEDARKDLAGTVGELGQALDDTRNEVVGKIKQYAPWAVGAVGSYVIVKVLRRAR